MGLRKIGTTELVNACVINRLENINGWTKAGTRLQFKLVTGISTGALIAPFAFLGPTYD